MFLTWKKKAAKFNIKQRNKATKTLRVKENYQKSNQNPNKGHTELTVKVPNQQNLNCTNVRINYTNNELR